MRWREFLTIHFFGRETAREIKALHQGSRTVYDYAIDRTSYFGGVFWLEWWCPVWCISEQFVPFKAEGASGLSGALCGCILTEIKKHLLNVKTLSHTHNQSQDFAQGLKFWPNACWKCLKPPEKRLTQGLAPKLAQSLTLHLMLYLTVQRGHPPSNRRIEDWIAHQRHNLLKFGTRLTS